MNQELQNYINQERKIGTEEFAAVMPEYCGIISNKPTTRAKLAKVEREESNFDFDPGVYSISRSSIMLTNISFPLICVLVIKAVCVVEFSLFSKVLQTVVLPDPIFPVITTNPFRSSIA